MARRAPHVRAEKLQGTCTAATGTSCPEHSGAAAALAERLRTAHLLQVRVSSLHVCTHLRTSSTREAPSAPLGLPARCHSHAPKRLLRLEALCCPPLAAKSFSLKSAVLCCARRFRGLCWRLFIITIF